MSREGPRAPEQDRELRCPRDGAAMAKRTSHDVTYDACERCGGLWFDASELRRVSGDPELEAVATRVAPLAELSPFGCPRCWGDCAQTRVGSVRVDACTSCRGVWLDAGELDAAQSELEALDRAGARLVPWQRLLKRIRPAHVSTGVSAPPARGFTRTLSSDHAGPAK